MKPPSRAGQSPLGKTRAGRAVPGGQRAQGGAAASSPLNPGAGGRGRGAGPADELLQRAKAGEEERMAERT
ncbi:Hypothetical predicted protein [Marmota monax]|uniref:Uncharacterized protein n=1 Tax=Marmota monax TaxID=9995 RepID=A0A5E4AIK3_MARMO|nr:hypothetical protein GHT09_006184 [Marmota monax]VTJ56539.1 Hypothetical predicted protein [Marmota monax]